MKRSRHTVFFSWLLSYFLILTVPTAVSLLGYQRMGAVLEEEIGKAGDVILLQAARSMDAVMTDLRRLAIGISLNKNLRSLLYRSEPTDASIRFSLWQIADKDLSAYATVFDPDISFYVYLANRDLVLVSGAWYSTEVAYRAFHEDADLSYDDWLALIRGNHNSATVPVSRPSSGKEILFLQTIPGEGGGIAGTVCALISTAVIERSLADIEWVSRSVFFIRNGMGRVIIAIPSDGAMATADNEARPRAVSVEAVRSRERLGGVEYVSTTVASNAMDWIYQSLIPVEYFRARLDSIRFLTNLGLLFGALMGAALSYILAKRNYGPLRELMQEVSFQDTPIRDKDDRNEFTFLSKAIQETLREKEDASRFIEERKPELRTTFLRSLLREPAVLETDIRGELVSRGIDLPYAFFLPLLFHVRAGPEIDTERALALLRTTLAGSGDLAVEAVDFEGVLACLVNFPDGFGFDSIAERARSAKNALQTSAGREVAVAAGSVADVGDIADSCRKAFLALEYRLVLGSDELIVFDRIRSGDHAPRFSMEDQRRLVVALKAGNREESLAMLDAAFAANLSTAGVSDAPSVERFRYFLFDLANTAAKALEGIDAAYKGELRTTMDPFAAISRTESASEAKETLAELFSVACKYVENRKRSHNTELREAVESYVYASYSDRNLSNTVIADRFSVNPSYLSRYFKEQSGEGLAEFIARVRISRAKDLLAQNMVVSEVAQKVGLSGDVALIKLFKRIEGVTPGRFKGRSTNPG